MTKDQIDMLRALIRGEIEAALMNESEYRWAYEQEAANNEGWETFIQSFQEVNQIGDV